MSGTVCFDIFRSDEHRLIKLFYPRVNKGVGARSLSDSDMDYKYYIEVLAALLTPTIAIITTYIAIQQYKNNRAKLRHELYEKRLVIYKGVIRLIRTARFAERIQPEDTMAFATVKSESRFLFGKDVTDYISILDDKAMGQYGLQLVEEKMTELTGNVLMPQEIKDSQLWFEGQEEIAAQKFMKYLDLKRVR